MPYFYAGVWEIFLPNVMANTSYKYEIADQNGHIMPLKADPYAVSMQLAPDTASKVADKLVYQWQDDKWMQERANSANHYHGPVSIYEVHLGSWKRKTVSIDNNEHATAYLNYHEFRAIIRLLINKFDLHSLGLLPYSFRRGGASFDFRRFGSFDRAFNIRRWASYNSANYISQKP